MGDMADMFLQEVCTTESMRDDYSNGFISNIEAYEIGFIDEAGIESEGISEAYGRNELLSLDGVNKSLLHESVKFDNLSLLSKVSESSGASLNEAAILNLINDSPTCNLCGDLMRGQAGKFGKFYFCGNRCDGQKTVSDKYWQSVRLQK